MRRFINTLVLISAASGFIGCQTCDVCDDCSGDPYYYGEAYGPPQPKWNGGGGCKGCSYNHAAVAKAAQPEVKAAVAQEQVAQQGQNTQQNAAPVEDQPAFEASAVDEPAMQEISVMDEADSEFEATPDPFDMAPYIIDQSGFGDYRDVEETASTDEPAAK